MAVLSISSIVAILIALYTFQLCPALGGRSIVGGWKPIKNVTDPEVVRVADFAVKEHNRQSNGLELKFVRVIRGEIQVVNGLNYKLVINGHYTQKPNIFEAVVYEKAGGKTLELVSFKKLTQRINQLLN